MAIIQWTPFKEMEKFFEDDDIFFPLARKGVFSPAMDLYEEGDNVIVEMPLTNVDPENVDVMVENDVLTIQGETRKEEEKKERGYWRKEIRSGSFNRSVQLPLSVQGNKAEASFEDGMLKIVIPKAEHVKASKINVEVKKK